VAPVSSFRGAIEGSPKMKQQSRVMSDEDRVGRAALGSGSSAGVALVVTLMAITSLRAWSSGTFTLLVLLPCLLACGSLAALFAFHASARCHVALATTTTILAVLTLFAYVPAIGDSGCMAGMALLACIPLSIGFPIVFGVCWLSCGRNGDA
jgi:hypothetical protein